MQITVIPKSTLHMKLQKSELMIDLPEGSTAMDAGKYLARQYGGQVADFLFDKKSGECSVLFAVNRKQVIKDHVLQDKDRLTILPPLAGG